MILKIYYVSLFLLISHSNNLTADVNKGFNLYKNFCVCYASKSFKHNKIIPNKYHFNSINYEPICFVYVTT